MSFKKKMLSEVISEYKKTAKRNVERIQKKADLLAFLEKRTGLDLCSNAYEFRYIDLYEVKLGDIKAIKNVVGDFSETFAKELCHDFEETGEIWVTCHVDRGEFDGFSFRYRHLLRDDDDCSVQEVTKEQTVYPAHTTNRLVCKRR